MLEKIEEFISEINLSELTIDELNRLTEIVIKIEEHKEVSNGNLTKVEVY